MSSLTRKRLESRVCEAAEMLGEALDNLRAYNEATRLVWHSVEPNQFATTLSESQLEKLVGDDDAVLRELSLRCAELRAALDQSGMSSGRR